ncbi:MAG TPA: sigma-54 dependent transcriptional regulator [Pyrinomonadaceae bacterium]|jgi:DNA-binding NtrC family response regulator|nr:sigma-54 dependent transcriptional regulator [Pyrinomonadaceae bacterium]
MLSTRSSLQALVIDDEPQISRFVAEVLTAEGWTVVEVDSADKAFEELERRKWPLVFCDVMLGGTNGYEVLRRFTKEQPEARFVLMTGHGSAAGALDATSIGAFDYLVKPFSVDDVIAVSKLVRERSKPQKKPAAARASPTAYRSDLPLIGKSQKFVECLKMVGRVAITDLPVLITGESGTGKEVVARAIHQRSSRASGPFVSVNCGAIPNELIESELFGHAKGSFTGAHHERVGLWEAATGGTLLLDEITETSPLFQVKILRALQEREIRRVGSNRTIAVDVRVIAASNRDIEGEVVVGRFRQDLMYRLNAVTIELPPLRERPDDVKLLAEHFAIDAGKFSGHPACFDPSTIEFLKNYSWPGNIRELENAVLHAISLSDGTIYPSHLPGRITGGPRDTENYVLESVESSDWLPLSRMQELHVQRVLDHTGGNKQAAARILEIDRKTLARILNRREER